MSTTTLPFYLPPDVDEQHAAWGANCGPAALAALLRVPVAHVREACQPFPGYVSFAHMLRALGRLGVEHGVIRRDFKGVNTILDPAKWWGRLVLIQWGGAWLNPGVRPGAALCRTHWVAVTEESRSVYDVNAGDWLDGGEWRLLAKLIMREVPRCDGTWSVRGSIVVRSPLRDG